MVVVNQLDNWIPLGHLNPVKVVGSCYAWMLVKQRKNERSNLLVAQTQKEIESELTLIEVWGTFFPLGLSYATSETELNY